MAITVLVTDRAAAVLQFEGHYRRIIPGLERLFRFKVINDPKEVPSDIKVYRRKNLEPLYSQVEGFYLEQHSLKECLSSIPYPLELISDVYIIGVKPLILDKYTVVIDYVDGKFRYFPELLVLCRQTGEIGILGTDESNEYLSGMLRARDLYIRCKDNIASIDCFDYNKRTRLYEEINRRYGYKSGGALTREQLKQRVRIRKGQYTKYQERVLLGGLDIRHSGHKIFENVAPEPYNVYPEGDMVKCLVKRPDWSYVKVIPVNSNDMVVFKSDYMVNMGFGSKNVDIPKNVYEALRFNPDVLSTPVGNIKYFKWALEELKKIVGKFS